MINAHDFVDAARSQGFDYYAGVPCSFLTPFINAVIGDPELTYVSAANEGDAVAAAAGAVIGGRGAIAMMQNSGLGNAVSPLTSLAYVFRIPLLLICTHRGAPGLSDEPQHALMGQITGDLFDTMAIPWEYFPDTPESIAPALARAAAYFAKEQRPYALVMKKGTVAKHELINRAPASRPRAAQVDGVCFDNLTNADRATRMQALETIIAATPIDDSVVIATTGFTGRELFAASDRDNHLYMVGSMGCATSLGLGLAMTRPDLHVVVVDGDGAALMRLGNMATLGAYGPANLTHILLDNEAHDSTGAQATVARSIDFAALASGCAYAAAQRCSGIDELGQWLAQRPGDGVRFAHMKIQTGTIDDLPRPSISPEAVLKRLRAHTRA